MKLNIIMKKITLNETDPIKIVNKVLNEQDERQFDEDQIELLNFIFERELKPPFRGGEPDKSDNYHYYNRDDEWIGWVDSDKDFELIGSFWRNIRDKVCSVFDVPRSGSGWWFATEPRLKSWMDAQLNIKIRHIR